MKRNVLIALAISTAMVLPCFAMAYYQITGCPDCGANTSVFFTTGGTGDLANDTDFVASASWGTAGQGTYKNIAEKYIPLQDTRVCVVRSKIQKFSGNYQKEVTLQVSVDTSIPDYTHYVEGANNPILASSSFDFVGASPPSFAWFRFQSCWTALAQHIYWFEFDSNNSGGGNGKWLTYQTNEIVAYNHGGFAQTQADSWIDTSRDWSFEIVNDFSQAQNNFPPASSSYNFQNKDFGALGNMFRDVVVWLFYPDQSALNGINSLWDKISHKPPIGYYTAVKDELSALSIGSSSLTFDTTAAASIINPLKTGLIAILWILFAFWIFHRLRNLDL